MEQPQKIKDFHYHKEDGTVWVVWIYGITDFKITFSVRCPSVHWHYYLPSGVDIHSKTKQYETQISVTSCNVLGSECFGDGSALAGDELWKEFSATGDEELIWITLKNWFNDRQP